MGRSEGKWRLWQKYSMKLHWETLWQRGRKMKGLCKEDKGEGRWETEAFGGYLHSPQTEKYIPCDRQIKTPICILSLFYTNIDPDRILIPGPLDSNIEPLLFLPVLPCLCPRSLNAVKSGLKYAEIIPARCITFITLEPRSAADTSNEGLIHRTGPRHLCHCCFPFCNDFI